MAVIVEAEDRFGALPALDREDGTPWSYHDRMFAGWRDGKVFDYSDWTARDLETMMKKDYKARQIEAALTFPTIRAQRQILPAKGDSGEADFLNKFWNADEQEIDDLNGGCETPLDLIVDQMTSAVVYKKSFHELVWTKGTGDFEGKIVLKRAAWRPQTTTRVLRDPKRNGVPVAIEQEPYWLGPGIRRNVFTIEIPANRSLIHIHGARRDPINGLSDLEVPYWAWKTKQKMLFLWWQFLEGVSLPRVVVKAQDDGISRAVAKSIAAARSSGVIPVNVDGRPDSVDIQALDLSGKGSDQFMQAVHWLDQCATNAVLAGFLDLTSNAAQGGNVGVHLSRDASDFFLMTLESKNREIERDIRHQLFAPMVRWNFGPKAKVPVYKFEPLHDEDKTHAVDMLTRLMASRDPALIPDEFIGFLVEQVTTYLGGDGKKIADAFNGAAAKAERQANVAKLSAHLNPQAAAATASTAKAAGAVNAAGRALTAAKAGKDPIKAANRGLK